jgi:predicted NAD/FAD-binding protein
VQELAGSRGVEYRVAVVVLLMVLSHGCVGLERRDQVAVVVVDARRGLHRIQVSIVDATGKIVVVVEEVGAKRVQRHNETREL